MRSVEVAQVGYVAITIEDGRHEFRWEILQDCPPEESRVRVTTHAIAQGWLREFMTVWQYTAAGQFAILPAEGFSDCPHRLSGSSKEGWPTPPDCISDTAENLAGSKLN